MGSKPSYPRPGSAVGSHWWEAWCQARGLRPLQALPLGGSTWWEGCLRTLPHRPRSWQEVQVTLPSTVGGASPAPVPVAEASGRALARETLCCPLETAVIFIEIGAWNGAFPLKIQSWGKTSLQIQTAPQAPSSASGVRSAAVAQELSYFFFLAASKVTLMFPKLKKIERRKWKPSFKQD